MKKYRCLHGNVLAAVLVALIGMAADATAQRNANKRPLAIVGVNVVAMTSESIQADRTVLIRSGKILQVAPRGEVKIPKNAIQVDGTGKYLMPGLSDLHVHFFGGKKYTPDLLKLYVANGVTTILNMRGTRGILELRGQVAAGKLLGPTIFTASPILGNFSPNPKTYEKGVEIVERFVEEGYDFIKVYNQIPREGYEGIVAAAKRLDIPLIGHAVRSVGIVGALENGQHIAHMEELIYGYFQDGLDETAIAPLARRFKEAGISIVATLVTYHNIIRQVEDIDAMLHSPGIEYLPDGMKRPWLPERNAYLARFTMDSVKQRLGPNLVFQQKLAKAFTEAGVPVLLGTDTCIPIVVPGYSAHNELEELVAAGLTPYEALVAGTRGPAEFLGEAEVFGTIEKGKRADLILLNGNPLEDISNTQDIVGVSVHGVWLDRKSIDAMLADILARKG